ncbi:MAG TPA: hypothetical protein VFP60_01375 [Pseudolabrys sp.]|nr:hypothetical protein [Pseudolabrys sp.]
MEGRPLAAFDLSPGERSLAQFLPEQAKEASIRDVNGQMALFDRLVAADGAMKVIDVGHDAFESFFALAHQIDFVEEAHGRSVAVAILFTVTPDQTSVSAYRALKERFRKAMLVPVHNEMLGPSQHRDKYPVAGSVAVRLPVLAPGLRKYMDSPPFSFAKTVPAETSRIPIDAHAELQRWLRRIHIEFRELDLRLLLADLRSSIGL